MTWTGFDIVTRRRHDRPRPEKLPFILPEEQELQRDPESIVVSDSKGLCDSLNNDLPSADRKSAMETPVIEEFCEQAGARFRWAPHNFNPSDALTKNRGAHLEPMLNLLKHGKYQLSSEQESLARRKEEK